MAFIGKDTCTLGDDQNLWGEKKTHCVFKRGRKHLGRVEAKENRKLFTKAINVPPTIIFHKETQNIFLFILIDYVLSCHFRLLVTTEIDSSITACP